jgi:hypothetical protein
MKGRRKPMFKSFKAQTEQQAFDLFEREFQGCRISGRGNHVLFFDKNGVGEGEIVLDYKEKKVELC